MAEEMPLMQPMEVTSPQGCKYKTGEEKMVEQIIKIKEMKLTDITINKGKDTYCIFAKIRIPGVRPIHVTYDCLNCNLIVHEWYLLDEDEIDEVYGEFLEFVAMAGRMYQY